MAEILVLHAKPYDPDRVQSFQYPPLPSGLDPSPWAGTWTLTGGETDVYVAWGTSGYTTQASDTPASTHIPGRIAEAFGYAQRLFAEADLINPGPAAGSGAIVIDDPDGKLDAWCSYAFDGRELLIKRGQDNADFSSFTTVARMTSDGLLWDRKTKTLRLRDFGWTLAVPLNLPRYAGTGGAEGIADLAGKSRPLGIGLVFNAIPTLLDPTALLFQYHCTAYQSVTFIPTVRVGGVAWSWSADYPTVGGLIGATIPSGYYASCKAAGLFRLGSAIPTGQEVRADFKGLGSGNPPLYEFWASAGNVISRVLASFAGLTAARGTGGSVEVSSSPSSGPTLGLFIGSAETPPSLVDVLNALTYPNTYFWWATNVGGINVRQIKDPATQTPDHTLSFPQDFAGEPTRTAAPPRASVTVRGARNWGPQARASIAGSVSETDADRYSREWLDGVASDVQVANRWRSARAVTLDSSFYLQTSVLDAAQYLMTLFGVQREVWSCPVRTRDPRGSSSAALDPLNPPLGKYIQIQNFNRLGVGSSKTFLCIGAQVSAEANALTLDLWG